MTKKRLKTWTLDPKSTGAAAKAVKTRSLGTVRLLQPSELEDTEYTVVGMLSTARKKFTGDRAAILIAADGKKADLLSQVPFSKLVGYLPTSTDGMYVAVRQPRIPLGIFLALLLTTVLTAGLALVFTQQEAETAQPIPEEKASVPELETNVSDKAKTVEEIREEKPNVTMPGWGTISIPADSTTVTVNFVNPEKNAGCYYMTFELLLKSGEETESLYQSGLVEPGKYVTDITLSRPLPAGEYDAVVHMQPYTMSDPPTATNSGDVVIKLIVQ